MLRLRLSSGFKGMCTPRLPGDGCLTLATVRSRSSGEASTDSSRTVSNGGVWEGSLCAPPCSPAQPPPQIGDACASGAWVRGRKKVFVPEIDLQFRAPLIHFIFFPRKNFLMWVGGFATRKSPGCRSAPPPAPVTVSRGLLPGVRKVGRRHLTVWHSARMRVHQPWREVVVVDSVV